MFYLLLAIVQSSMISILLRLSSGKIKANISMLAFNYLTCSILGGLYAGLTPVMTVHSSFGIAVGLGIVNGILLLTSFILMQASVRKNGVVLTSVFTKLGLLVPVVLSVVAFREMPTWLQIIGFCIAVTASIVINLNNGEKAGRFDWSLVLLLLLAGGTDAMAKIYESLGSADLSDPYLFFSFGAALVLCIPVVLSKKERPGFRELLFGVLIGIPNFFSSKFLLMALNTVPAVVAYPTFSVSTLLLITITGVLAFREKLSKLQWASLAAILVALVMLNV